MMAFVPPLDAIESPFQDARHCQFMADCPVGAFTKDPDRKAPSGRIAARQCFLVMDWFARFLFPECLAAAGRASAGRIIRELPAIEDARTLQLACAPLREAYGAAVHAFEREAVHLGLYRNRIAREAAKRALDASEATHAVTAILVAATVWPCQLAATVPALRAIDGMSFQEGDAADLQKGEKYMGLQMHLPGKPGLGFKPSTFAARAAVVADEALAPLKASIDVSAADLLTRMLALEEK